jgi:hypothetical protein
MSAPAPYITSQANFQRTPIYKAKFDSWDMPYSTVPINIIINAVNDTDTVSDTFAINETKTYVLEDDYPHINNSVVGDLFAFSHLQSIATTKPYASDFSGQQSQVFPEQGHSSIGSITFVLTDVSEYVTAMVMGGVLGDRVQLFAGFDDIDEADYWLFFTGIVAEVRLTSDLAGYEFTVYTTQSLLNRQVFNVAISKLTTPLTAGFEVDFSIDPTLGLIEGLGVYVKIDDEIFWCDVIDAATGHIGILARAQAGTVAAAHAVDVEVREVIHLGPAHPMTILLGLYQNTDKTGCGLNPTYIDMAGIAAAIPLIGTIYQMEFWITEPANAVEWAESEIFKPTGSYPVNKSDGRNSIVVFHAPSADEAISTLDHDAIVHDGSRILMTWSMGRDGSLGQVINDVTFKFDWNLVTGQFEASFQLERQSSIDRFGRRPIVIESMGLRSDIAETLSLIETRALAIVNRYENGCPLVQLTTLLNQELIEPGEIVMLTSDKLPNRFTKTRGVVEALFEVVNRNIRFSEGLGDFDLLHTSFSDLARDDFNRANVLWLDDNLLGTDAAWSAYAQDTQGIRIEDGQLFLGRGGTKLQPAGSGNGIVVRNQNYGANQSSQFTYKNTAGSGGFSGPLVRGLYVFASSPANYLEEVTGYAGMYDTIAGELSLRYYDHEDPTASTGTELAVYPVTLVDGDTVRIDVRGTNLRVFVNDALVIGPIIHTALTAGAVGGLSNYNSTAGGTLWDDWVGGDNGWS